jgi:hypothetical protein
MPGARMPEHTLDPPAPVVARILWEDDGEEYIETEAAGWSVCPPFPPWWAWPPANYSYRT